MGILGDRTATGALEWDNLVSCLLDRQGDGGVSLLLCLEGIGAADGKYWWMGTGAFMSG